MTENVIFWSLISDIQDDYLRKNYFLIVSYQILKIYLCGWYHGQIFYFRNFLRFFHKIWEIDYHIFLSILLWYLFRYSLWKIKKFQEKKFILAFYTTMCQVVYFSNWFWIFHNAVSTILMMFFGKNCFGFQVFIFIIFIN